MTTQQMLDERYGRGRGGRPRRGVWIAMVILGLLAGGLAWMTWSAAAQAVQADATGFELVDEHLVTVTFQVTAPPGSSISCALEAQDVGHAVVGWRVVQYPPSDAHAQAFSEPVPTVAAATTGLVNSCWVS